MALYDLWVAVHAMPDEDFQQLRRLAQTESFSVVASGITNDGCLRQVVQGLRNARLQGFPQRGAAKNEARLVVQAITSRIVSEPRPNV